MGDSNSDNNLFLELIGADYPHSLDLLERGADVNIKDVFGWTSLHAACQNDNLKVAKLLIDHGAEVNAKDGDGHMPLHMTCHENCLESAKLLLESSAEVNAKDNDGKTPLHLACELGAKPDMAKLLIDNGADVHAKDNDGKTPLHLACELGAKPDMAKLLIDNGADVHAKDNDGKTPLHLVCDWYGKPEMAKLLIDNGADVHAEDNAGMTPLHVACSGDQHEAYNRRAKIRENNYEERPFLKARRQDHLKLVNLLLSRGANVHAKEPESGKTPLHLASEENHLDIVWGMVRQGYVDEVFKRSLKRKKCSNPIEWWNFDSVLQRTRKRTTPYFRQASQQA